MVKRFVFLNIISPITARLTFQSQQLFGTCLQLTILGILALGGTLISIHNHKVWKTFVLIHPRNL